MKKNLFKSLYLIEAEDAVFGTINDRKREDKIYCFGTPNYTYTLEAESDKIAIAALIIGANIQNVPTTMHYPATSLQIPFTTENLNSLFGSIDGLSIFMCLHKEQLIASLKSVLYGNQIERFSLMNTIEHMTTWDEGKKESFIGDWHTDKINKSHHGISSTNDIRISCLMSVEFIALIEPGFDATLTESYKEKLSKQKFI